jgi:hypothetical protein
MGNSPIIPDTTTDARMSGLENFLERYLGPRRPEYGETEEELAAIEMPDPLRRFFRFAGRWPHSAGANPFCVQDSLCELRNETYIPPLSVLDGRLIFVMENQGVWVAATERSGEDPPVWIAEEYENDDPNRDWCKLEKPLSHFLVSFALQEVLFGSEVLGSAAGALEKFESAGLDCTPLWIDGEYAWDFFRTSYFLIDGRLLLGRVRRGEDRYASGNPADAAILASLELPTD